MQHQLVQNFYSGTLNSMVGKTAQKYVYYMCSVCACGVVCVQCAQLSFSTTVLGSVTFHHETWTVIH